MKKSLSLLLAIALVVSMFGSLAYAADAELTVQQKYDALKAKDIFAGINGEAALDQPMTRAQLARVAALIKGLEGIGKTDTKVVTEAPFSDVKLGTWFVEEIAAGKEAGFLHGDGAPKNTFRPNDNISVQDFAVIFAQVMGLEKVEGASVEGAAAYAAPYIQALLNVGLQVPTNYTEDALRSDLVNVSFAADAALNPVVATSFTAVASAAKKFTLTFNAPVDTAKANISVKNASSNVNVKSTAWSADNKSVVLEFHNNLAEAEYTVTVSGLTETALTATVKVDAEKVAKIEIQSDKATLVRGSSNLKVEVPYVIYNQYDENVSGSNSISVTSSKGAATASDGVITIDNTTAANAYVLNEVLSVTAIHATTGTFASATLTVAPTAQVGSIKIEKLYQKDNKELQKSMSTAIDTFWLVLDLKDQYGRTVSDEVIVGEDVYVTVSNPSVVTVKDYGTPSSNKATFSKEKIDGNDRVVLKLAGTVDKGTSTVTIISSVSGNKDSIELSVKDTVKIGTLTLSTPAVAVAGEEVEIPYTAIDQFGNAIEHPTDGQVSLSVTGTGNAINFKRDYVKNKTNLILDLDGMSSEGTVIITSVAGTTVNQLTVPVKKPAVPAVVDRVQSVDLNLMVNGTTKLESHKIVVNDQYGRDASTDRGASTGAALQWGTTTGKYFAKVSVDNGNVTSSSNVFTGSAVTLTGATKGSANVTLKLYKITNDSGLVLGTESTWAGKTEELKNSAYSFGVKVVGKDAIQSYEASVAGTVYSLSADPDYAKELKVVGILADGSKVTVPNDPDNYNVIINTANVDHTTVPGKISGNGFNGYATNANDAEINIVVAVKGNNTIDNLIVPVKLSKSGSSVATLVLKESWEGATLAAKEGDGVVSAELSDIQDTGVVTQAKINAMVADIIKVSDQYGKTLTKGASDYTIVVNNIVSNGASKTAVADIVEGSTFNVTAVSNQGSKIINFKVIVK